MSPVLTWFVMVARSEGLSLLMLFFLAMPLKYGLRIEEPIAGVGWMHGTLVFLYVIALGSVARAEGWPLSRVALWFVASLLPAGTFVAERRLLDGSVHTRAWLVRYPRLSWGIA